MKTRPEPRVKSASKKKLPAPLSGLAVDDLLWDYASPLASLIFEDLEREPPPATFWGTVSGMALYAASNRRAQAAKGAYEGTTAPVLRRLREITWLYRRELATQNAMLLWAALLRQQMETYPNATDGQLWVLVRDALRALFDEYFLAEGDGR